MLGKFLLQGILNEVLLHLAERHNTNGTLRQLWVAQTTNDFLHNCLSLSLVAACLTHVINTIHRHIRHLRLAVIDRREGVEFSIVVLRIAESNKALMLRTIVPCEVAGWHGHGDAVVENTFHVVKRSIFLVEGAGLEETRWWHLFRVAHTDECLTTGNGTHSLARWHLRCLVEHHDVELIVSQVQILRHADRTHQHAWAESW